MANSLLAPKSIGPHGLYGREHFLVQLFTTHTDALGVFDTEMKLIACNPAALALGSCVTGTAPTPGTSLLNTLPPERQAFISQVVSKVLKGSLQEYDLYLPPPAARWVCLRYYPAYNEEGTIYGFYIHAHDITRQRRVQEELQLHTTLFHNISDAVIATDLQFCISSFNQAAERIYGLKAEEVMRLSIGSVIRYEYLNSTEQEARDALQQKGEWKGEVIYARPDKQKVYLLSTVTYVRNEEGDKVGAIAVNKDITELVKAREEASRSQAYTEMVLENNGDAFMVLDKTYRIILFNQLACTVMQQFVHGTVQQGVGLLDLLTPERRRAVRGYLAKTARGRSVEYEVAYPDGSWLWVSFIPVKVAGGARYTICIIRDITARKEKERRVLDEKLRHQHELTKATLFAQEKERNAIGSELHDNINQILTAVKLQLGICLEQDNGNPWLQKAQLHVQTVIDEIRQLSRKLVTPRFSEDGLIQKIETLLESYRPNLAIAFDYTTFSEEGLDGPTRLTLFRVVQEVLNNIIRHAAAQQVWVHLAGREHSLVLVITDDGRGFDPKEARTGVGLTNIYNRVEAARGTVRLRTAPGEGCRLTVRLPVNT